MEPTSREVISYTSTEGYIPFEEWLFSLKDTVARTLILKRLNRVRMGNFGDCRSLRGGLWELKSDFGPGYRIYYGEDGLRLVILLMGGDKSSQSKDIQKAREYWKDYHETKA